MTWVAIAVVVAVVYVCVVTFAIAVLRAAKRADEAAERPRALAAGERRFEREEQPLELTPEDAAFLERLGRR
jgi:hypothetical protein